MPTASSEPLGSTGPSEGALVPDGASLGGAGIDDALGLLCAAMAQQRQNGLETSKSRVQSAEKQEEQALSDEQAAQAREQANQAHQGRGFFSSIGHLLGDVTRDATHGHLVEAAKDAASDVKEAADSPAFWNDLEQGALVVAKVAAVVGSAVVTGATLGGGAATIAGAALLMSVSGEVVSDTKCFGKLSEDIGVGLQLAGAVTGFGGGLLSDGMEAASKTAVGVGAAVSGFGGEAQVVAGGAHIENQGFLARAQDAAADVQAAVNRDGELQQLTGWVVDDLKASDKSHQKAEQSLQSAIQTNDQGMAAAAASISVRG